MGKRKEWQCTIAAGCSIDRAMHNNRMWRRNAPRGRRDHVEIEEVCAVSNPELVTVKEARRIWDQLSPGGGPTAQQNTLWRQLARDIHPIISHIPIARDLGGLPGNLVEDYELVTSTRFQQPTWRGYWDSEGEQHICPCLVGCWRLEGNPHHLTCTTRE